MTSLTQFLPQDIFGFLLVMIRIGSMLMLLPAIGDNAIPVTVRVALAFAISIVLYPIVKHATPALPAHPWGLATAATGEIAIGAFIGLSVRLMIAALHVAGVLIAAISGLSLGETYDPTQASHSPIIGNFMSLVGMTLIFMADLHFTMIRAMQDSYVLFPPMHVPNMADFATMAMQSVSGSFLLGMQIAAPFLVYAVVFNVGLGLIARLMPTVQVFFISQPLQILLAFGIFMLTLSSGMMWFLDHFQQNLLRFTV